MSNLKENLVGTVIKQTFLKDGSPGLPLKEYQVSVLKVPPNYEIELGIASIREEIQTITGYTLEDAKRKAGIQ